MPLLREKIYRVNDIFALPDGQRAELIDGQIYYMAPLTRSHQAVLNYINTHIYQYIEGNKENFESEDTVEYSFADSVKAGIYEDLSIDFSYIDLNGGTR